jgi:pyridoxamine 5'-phosphate oxidase
VSDSTRVDYSFGNLIEDDLEAAPEGQLQRWLNEADTYGIREANAMCISTVGPDHRPSSRMVLLRGLDTEGLLFFTNYNSRKGEELERNPAVCATFWWGPMERQVRVEGRVERASPEESDDYFHSRPRESQIASIASPQSQPIPNREFLESRIDELRAQLQGEIPRPSHWGGYRIVPDRFEFWQGRGARLHDRLVMTKSGEGWTIHRLAP